MLCDRCKKNQAAIHLTEIIKDQRSEIHICEECARTVGFSGKLARYQLNQDTISEYINQQTTDNTSSTIEVCNHCGMTTRDLQLTGKAGCPGCYNDLESLISATSMKNHDLYCGKIPYNYIKTSIETISDAEESEGDSYDVLSIEELKNMLEDAVREERYEDAASIRDRISEMAAT